MSPWDTISECPKDLPQDQLLKMIRDLQGRVSALEGQRGSGSKSSRCCSMTTDEGEDAGYCHMSNGEARPKVSRPLRSDDLKPC